MPNKSKLDLMYLLPNLFTAASIFFAVLCVLESIAQQYMSALTYLFVSLICDGLDGRVARAVNRTSKFGVEFDSLADIVAFGVAPAVLFYYNLGIYFGRFGQIAMALFIILGAVRLARFNITTGSYEPNVFIGLPIPTAAVVLALWTAVFCHYDLERSAWGYCIVALAILLGILMVSNLRYPSFKKLNFNKHMLRKILVFFIIFCSLIYLFPLFISTIIVSIYLLYGLVRAGLNLSKSKIKYFKGNKG